MNAIHIFHSKGRLHLSRTKNGDLKIHDLGGFSGDDITIVIHDQAKKEFFNEALTRAIIAFNDALAYGMTDGAAK